MHSFLFQESRRSRTEDAYTWGLMQQPQGRGENDGDTSYGLYTRLALTYFTVRMQTQTDSTDEKIEKPVGTIQNFSAVPEKLFGLYLLY